MISNVGHLAAYLAHIGFDAQPRADAATLQQLHALHPLRIPFENLNSWLGLPVLLDDEAIFSKLIVQGRGGYCFEHNLLFMRMLNDIGFDVQGLAARVVWQLPPDQVLPRTHMLLLVSVGGRRYVADVGFGGLTMTTALHLDSEAAQNSSHETFRIAQHLDHHEVQVSLGGAWQPLYRFSLEAQAPADYTMANWYVSTHPQSRFTSQLIAGRADATGRHALLNNRYTHHSPNATSTHTQLESPAAVRNLLEKVLLINSHNLPGLDTKLASLFS